MKVENKTIIITDPCYILPEFKKDLWGNGIDYMNGDGIQEYGIKNFIWEQTIYGDWSCTTWDCVEHPEDVFNKILKYSTTSSEENEVELDKIADTLTPLGKFTADSGMVGVFILDEVLEFNPDFDKWIEEHNWCVTVIEDYSGEIYTITNEEYKSVIGDGYHSFFTTQTGF